MKIDTDFCESGVRINFRFTQEDVSEGELDQMRWAMMYLADRATSGHESEKWIMWFEQLEEFLGNEYHGVKHRIW